MATKHEKLARRMIRAMKKGSNKTARTTEKGMVYGCCWEHGEKTASMRFEPKTGRCHCYGCGIELNLYKDKKPWRMINSAAKAHQMGLERHQDLLKSMPDILDLDKFLCDLIERVRPVNSESQVPF